MATTTAKGSGSTVNDGGTVLGAGNVSADSKITKVLSVADVAVSDNYAYGAKVIAKAGTSQDYSGVATANSAGSGGLAYFPSPSERNFIVKAAGDSASKINNDSVTLLSVVGSDYAGVARHDYKLVSTRKLGSDATASFNILARPSTAMVPGRTKGAGAGGVNNYVQVDGTTAAVDDAASATRSVPGELTYMFGSVVPKQDDYKAKNSYES